MAEPVAQEVEAKGHDGAMIPLSIIYKKGLKKDYIQIAGHTAMKQIDLDGNDKFTGGRYYFIDTMETSGDYLIIEDNQLRTNSVK